MVKVLWGVIPYVFETRAQAEKFVAEKHAMYANCDARIVPTGKE